MYPRISVPLALTVVLAAAMVYPIGTVHAAWPHNPYSNLPVCIVGNNQDSPRTIPDGAGGAIITWEDRRGGTYYDIYAQHVLASGMMDPAWPADGRALCTANGDQMYPTIVSDGAGGAIVAWPDFRSGIRYDIYAQHVLALGMVDPAWPADGRALCTANGDQEYPTIVSDGAGGAIVAWGDNRGGNWDTYAQRISAAGAPQWTPDGVALCTAAGDQSTATIVSDGAGGAIVAWVDARGGSWDIYARRISAAGVPQWPADGVALCTAAGDQSTVTIVSDGASGAIVAWVDARGGNLDIYTQHISAAGAPQWTPDGVALCTAAGDQSASTIVSDGTEGAVVAWVDARGGSWDIFAQCISAAGAPRWTANGVVLCAATGDQSACTIVSDGAGGAIAAWHDYRNGNYDIYAQRVARLGYLGDPAPRIYSVADVPNDQGGKVKLSWYASYLDPPPYEQIISYQVYRSVPPNQAQELLQQGARFAVVLEDVKDGAERVLIASTQAGATRFWEYVGAVNPARLEGYSYLAPMACDSTSTANPWTSFMVRAVGGGPGAVYWDSAPDSGYSVDNLPPGAPAPFTGEYASGTTTLHWGVSEAPDFAIFRLYRGKSEDFIPGPENFVAAPTDTGYVDDAGSAYYYKLSAVDVHGNESGYALLLPSGAVSVQDPQLPSQVWLGPAVPNPMGREAVIRFGLPMAGQVRLVLYDLRGRQVRMLSEGEQPAGEQVAHWDGRDAAGRAVPSGVYLFRLEAMGKSLTGRLAKIN